MTKRKSRSLTLADALADTPDNRYASVEERCTAAQLADLEKFRVDYLAGKYRGKSQGGLATAVSQWLGFRISKGSLRRYLGVKNQ